MTTTANNQFFHFQDGIFKQVLSETEARLFLWQDVKIFGCYDGVCLKPPVPPVKELPVFGAPRTLLGTDSDGHNVYALTGVSYLALQVGEKPDAIAFRGTNLDYTALPGVKRPTGWETPWSGTQQPADAKKPDGYYKKYFKGNALEPYYVQGNQPDDTPAGSKEEEVIIPPTPTPQTNPTRVSAVDILYPVTD